MSPSRDPDYSADALYISQISYNRYAEFYVGKIPRIRIGGPPLQRCMVLKRFYSLSRRNTFVGGTCALLSALLVSCSFYAEFDIFVVKGVLTYLGSTMFFYLPLSCLASKHLAEHMNYIHLACHSHTTFIGGATGYAKCEIGYAKHTLLLDPSIKFHCHITRGREGKGRRRGGERERRACGVFIKHISHCVNL